MFQANQTYKFNFPTDIRFGCNVSNLAIDFLKSKNIERVFIVSDKTVSQLEVAQKWLNNLKKADISIILFSDFHSNPVASDVVKGATSYQNEDAEGIIGFGGGASIDVARAIALACHHPKKLFEYEDGVGDHFITQKIPPFLAIPTTAGTGSEVGRSAIISEDITHKKKILFSPRLMAQLVLADPLLTMDMPAHITAATGMDALTHNIEAYLAKNFHPICDGIAMEGMKLIHESIVGATKRPTIENRAKMLLASMMGAISFQKGLGVVHSLAHPLSTLCNTHHGLANAMMLSHGLEFNKSACAEKYQAIKNNLGIQDVVEYAKNLQNELEIPANLKKIGVTKEQLEPLSQLALEDFCHPNNPKVVTKADFFQMYQQSWG